MLMHIPNVHRATVHALVFLFLHECFVEKRLNLKPYDEIVAVSDYPSLGCTVESQGLNMDTRSSSSYLQHASMRETRSARLCCK